jgi:hypothetical protein
VQPEDDARQADEQCERNKNPEQLGNEAAVQDCEADGMQRMAGGKAVAIERRRCATDLTEADEGTFAHEPLFEKSVSKYADQCGQPRLRAA